jgi:hypothetical protein
VARNDETKAGAVDAAGPWTIKSCSTSTREAVIMAARKEGITVGAWLDRRVREWTEEGGPTRVESVDEASGLARVSVAFRALAAAGVIIPKTHIARLTSALLAQAGLDLPRREPPPIRINTKRATLLPLSKP